MEQIVQENVKTPDMHPVQPYLSSFVKLGGKNNTEDVKKLQSFLNDFEGEKLVIDGIYKSTDFTAVKRFQKKYTREILTYWNINTPTGYVYITTTEMINKLVRENLQK